MKRIINFAKRSTMEWMAAYLLTHSRITEDEVFWTNSCPRKARRLIRLAGSAEKAEAYIQVYMKERKEATDLIEMIAAM